MNLNIPFSQGIQSEMIDAVSHTNYRTEFHLDSNKVMLPSLRLTNLGVLDSTAAGVTNKFLDPIGGIMSIIKNIYLMDGGQVLDQMQNVQVLGTFSENNKSNDVMVSSNSQVSGASMGMAYSLESTTLTAAASNNAVREDKFITTNVVAGNDYTADSVFRFNIDSTNKTTCHLDLSKCFNLLNNINVLSTNVFKNLRIVVEYNDLSKCVFQLSNLSGTAPVYSTTSIGIQRPTLLVDYVTNENNAMNLEKQLMGKTINYRVLESDNVFNVGVGTGNNFNEKVYGFDTKTLLRLACFKQGNILSQSLAHSTEKINFVINGKQYLPYTGLDAKNKSLMYLVESWGQFGMKGDENDYQKRILNSRQLTDNTYTGLLVGKRIDELIVNYSNTAGVNTMNLIIIGEVVKSITFNNNGSYVVSYA